MVQFQFFKDFPDFLMKTDYRQGSGQERRWGAMAVIMVTYTGISAVGHHKRVAECAVELLGFGDGLSVSGGNGFLPRGGEHCLLFV